jgi:proteasome assembly chaperone (PAC2) family protein
VGERSGLYELHEKPAIDHPILVLAPEGWIDAGLGGGAALAAIQHEIPTELVATFDTDELLDYRARRPVSVIIDGVYEDLGWHVIELRAGQDGKGQGVLVLTGPEPDRRWRAYAEAVGDLAAMFDVRMLVGLGAFPAPIPHTRTPSLVATATTADLANTVGVIAGRIQAPSGVLAAIERRFAAIGIPAIGLWARVPHYAATMPYPEASAQLLDGLAKVTGIEVDASAMREAAGDVRRKLDELTANSTQHTSLVRQLESQYDAQVNVVDVAVAGGWDELPTGDELAAELEKYLRDQGP